MIEPISASGITQVPPTRELSVPLCVDNRKFIAGFQLNHHEHFRRQTRGLQAISSTGLLHALWELPHDIPFPVNSFNELDRATLESADDGWVKRQGADLLREYQPPGVVRSVTVSDHSLKLAISKAAACPPIFRRIAIWRTSACRHNVNSFASVKRATALGIGVIVDAGSHTYELVQPAQPMRGLPSVFRWWQAEIAYRNWISSREPTDEVGAWA